MTKRTFLITGASSGLGRAFAQGALAAGHTVVGTVRKPEDLEKFEALGPGRAHGRQLDVTDDDAVASVVAEVERTVGPIDVLIANAGYGHEGVFEESPMAELRAQFEVNVFGVAATVHAVLPGMRKRRSGHIFAVSSMGGLMTVPGLAYYCGSKYAVEGMLETLSKEVAGFGVRVTIIEPGSFRTDWAGRSMVRSDRSIADYDELFEPIRAARQAASGNQLGNPVKAAEAVLAVIEAEKPPVHLVLGSDALRLVASGRAAVAADIEAWEELSRSTDFPDGHQIAAN
ncbi:oxidoreductase [Amycolatopsis endophytica]|uniref:NAD(P)-dependent dehydrogenase (Short-subunit alcohol dehydrogenase family) n=1 Tax=Amycolatopsis endophytica TaxID=860233 RepID=A0A853B8S2_9PSEU|nr:oxidoreductase [Amycolatopsis endophytica]NYI91718.1 NAD(P)-dependent dehydrogenase (short-subunit alcohol dehydrogenase family) [Amycolatopsis endophytica]